MKKYFWAIISMLSAICMLPTIASGKDTISKEQVVAQMNYCINSITNVVHYKSMPLLEHEIDQLLNNLTMEQVVGLYEVQSFRSEMIEKISALQITEEEKELMKRIQEMKRENLLYQSISNSLNPTLLLTGGGNNSKQLAFMAIITVARTAVEYKSASNEADIEELQAMWKYRKEDLKNFADLRKDALELVYNLFQKYSLNENDRLTEATSTLFSQIIAEEDPKARIRKLLDNKSTFEEMADYYYYLGMAYVDANNYQAGKQHLDKYSSLYQKAPIFRYDEKSGCIALSKLVLEKGLRNTDVVHLVNEAIENLPNNGPAIIQSVLSLNEVGEKEKAFNILRSGIDNDLVSDKDALVLLATKLLPEIKKYPSCLEQITSAIRHCSGLSINSYIPFIANLNIKEYWDEIESVIHFDEGGEIVVSPKFKADISAMMLQKEIYKREHLTVTQCIPAYANTISKRTINRKFKTLKSNPEQIYIFFDPISEDNEYKVKKSLDYQKIIDGDYPGMSKPYISAKERKKIAKFCRKRNEASDGRINIIVKEDRRSKKLSTSLPYADDSILKGLDKVDCVDYSGYKYTLDSSYIRYCKINTRQNTTRVFPPLKNYPKNTIRIILPGTDTLQLCFKYNKGYSLHSVLVNELEYFKVPYEVGKDDSQEIEKNASKKEGFFKRFLRKRMNWGEKASKAILPDSLDDKIEDIYSSSYTVTGGIWHSIFKKKNTDAPKATDIEDDSNSSAKTSDAEKTKEKGNKKTLWDIICFWKK